MPFFGEIQEAEATKGQGVYTKKFGSETSDLVCGVNLCSEIPMNNDKKRSFDYPSTPLGQFYFGIPIDKILCNAGYELVIKASNLHPACVKPYNVDRLIEIGWAVTYAEMAQLITLAEYGSFGVFSTPGI